jgi:hypothetical protein
LSLGVGVEPRPVDHILTRLHAFHDCGITFSLFAFGLGGGLLLDFDGLVDSSGDVEQLGEGVRDTRSGIESVRGANDGDGLLEVEPREEEIPGGLVEVARVWLLDSFEPFLVEVDNRIVVPVVKCKSGVRKEPGGRKSLIGQHLENHASVVKAGLAEARRLFDPCHLGQRFLE